MSKIVAQDRLQPALLDRLTDDDPTNPTSRRWRCVSSAAPRMREAVLRDLSWLFNTTFLVGGRKSSMPYPDVQSIRS